MWILKAAVCLAMPVLIAGQCDEAKGDKIVEKRPDPFLPDGSGEAVAVWTEVTSSQMETTYTVREEYDKKTDRAFLEFFNGNEFQKILFDRKNQLFYSYTDNNCSKVEINMIPNFYRRTPLLRQLRLTNVPAKGFLGPASIFDELSRSYVKIATTTNCTMDRLIPCVQYKTCEGSPTNYWYSKDGYSLFGQSKSRPLRYIPESGLLVDVLSIKTYSTGQGLFIPTGLSCLNTGAQGATATFPTGRRSFSGEVVMTIDNIDKVLVSKLDGLILPSNNNGTASGIYSFTSSTFRTNGEGDLVTDGQTKIIHDVDHNIVFTRYTRDDPDRIALKETKCYVRPANDFQLELEFPTYGTISLTPIFLATPISASNVDVSDLGPNRIGTTDTKVTEVTYARLQTGTGVSLSRLIVSHHFASTTGQLTAVEINAFNMSNAKIFSGTVYINKYETTITKLNEKLRVDDCEEYQDSSESRWVEIGFEDASSGAVAQIEGSAFQIREAFIEELFTEYGVAPMRLPQINVDFVDQQVLVKALLLERPLLDLAYKNYLKKDFRNPAQILGVMSLSACQITCLGLPHCTAVTYCGATCSTSNASIPAAPGLTVNSDECFLYEREFSADIFSSSKILKDLQKDVTTPATESSLRLKFATAAGDGSSGGSQNVEITAITFDDTKNFDNAFHYDKEKVAIVETSYILAKPKRRYTTVSKASLLGSFDLEDCALACKNRPSCEAFSFCMNSMECMISRNHDIDDNELEEDSACVAYQKKYVDRFERFPGLTILGQGPTTVVTGAESCAQMCVQRADCKSFEMCDLSGECLLLTTHIADTKAVTRNDNEAKCDHYSKRFLYDYAILPKKRGTGDKTTELATYTKISQAACAKLCSEWGNSNSTCLSFDFCGPMPDNTGTCTLRTVDGKESSDDNTCSFLYLTVPPSEGIVRHGSGEAVGLSILMMLVGAGLAVGGLFLFNKYH